MRPCRHLRLLLLIAFMACAQGAAVVRAESPADPKPNGDLHVIQISVDGLGSLYLKSYLKEQPQNFPNFRRFVDEGATTFNARTDVMRTITLPNHTCMLTGRPVFPPEGQPASVAHNYTSNTDPKEGQTLHTCNPAVPYMASTLDVAHDGGAITGFYASKSKFSLFTTSADARHGAAASRGPNKVDHQCIRQSPNLGQGNLIGSAVMQERFIADLTKFHMGYSFVHYAEPDSAGHAKSWGSAT